MDHNFPGNKIENGGKKHYRLVMEIDARLRLRHLRGFLETARMGSVAAAAESLGVSQPAVSKTLRELEEILGAALFDRAERKLKLNASGRAFQKFAGGALAELARGQRAVRKATTLGARLSIGVLPTAASELAPRAALRFRAAHPSCGLHVFTGPNWLLSAQLREGRLDLVVGRMSPPEAMVGLTFEQLYAEDVVLVARAGAPIATATAATMHDALAQAELILPPPGALIRPTVDAYLTHMGLGGKEPLFETVSLAFGRRAVQLSDAAWFISRGVVADELRSGVLVAVDLKHPLLAGAVGVSLREGAAPSVERDGLVTALRETASEMVGPRAPDRRSEMRP